MKKIRILAFSDLHGNEKAIRILKKKAKNADLIICAGDFTVFEDKILSIMRKIDGFGKPVMLVNGNHEDYGLVSEICGKLKNTKQLHKKVFRHDLFPDLVFVGHGGEGFDTKSEDFDKFIKGKEERLEKLKEDGRELVLITHQPPHKTKLDYIWDHHGNKSYTKFIKKFQPVLAVCGHLHETQGKEDKIGKTKLINPGPKGKVVLI
jgi:uncharacterized protein